MARGVQGYASLALCISRK